MSVKCIPPHTPLLYSETGVYRGIAFFLIFDPKHRLWVLVRTGSNVYPQSMFGAKKMKILDFFHFFLFFLSFFFFSFLFFFFTALRKSNILHGHVFVRKVYYDMCLWNKII